MEHTAGDGPAGPEQPALRAFPRLVGGPQRLPVSHELFQEGDLARQLGSSAAWLTVDEESALADLAETLQSEAMARFTCMRQPPMKPPAHL